MSDINDFVNFPLKKLLNADNAFDRIEALEAATGPQDSVQADFSDEMFTRTGEVVTDNLYVPAEGVEVLDPTDTTYTGHFISSLGQTFSSIVAQIGGVAAGVLQWGANTSGQLLAGAGAVVLDALGVSVEASTGGSTNLNSYKFTLSGVITALLAGYQTGATNGVDLDVKSIAGIPSILRLMVTAPNTYNSQINLLANNGGGSETPQISLLYVGSAPASIILNALQKNADTSIYGNSDINLFFVDASASFVGVGTRTPAYKLDVNGTFGVAGAATFGGAVTLGDAVGDAITFTGTPAGLIVAGTYTPTLTNVTNVASSTAAVCQYMRVGNVVTVSGSVTIDPTATGAAELGVTFPLASAITDITQCGGMFGNQATASNVGVIGGDVTNDRARFLINAVDAASRVYLFTFTYQIL